MNFRIGRGLDNIRYILFEWWWFGWHHTIGDFSKSKPLVSLRCGLVHPLRFSMTKKIRKGSLVEYRSTGIFEQVGLGHITKIENDPPPGYSRPYAYVKFFAQKSESHHATLAWDFGCPLHCLRKLTITEAVLLRMKMI